MEDALVLHKDNGALSPRISNSFEKRHIRKVSLSDTTRTNARNIVASPETRGIPARAGARQAH